MGGGGTIYGLTDNALFHRFRLQWIFPSVVLATLLLLAACSSDSAEAPVQPSPTPTATPEPSPTAAGLSADFATAEIQPPDQQRLAQLTELLDLVPADYGSAVHLDLKAIREDPYLAAIDPETLGLEMALPSLISQVLDRVVLAVDFESRNVITGFEGAFQIADLLNLAGRFGLRLGDDGPENYRDHQIWTVNFLDVAIAMGSARDSTGVAASGAEPDTDYAILVKQSLDSFDGQSPRLLDDAAATRLLENLPSGFVSVVIADCGKLTLFADLQGLPGCAAAVVSADLVDPETAVFNFLVGFGNADLAEAAVELARDALEAQSPRDGIWEVGVRQEGDLVRARVIADLPQFEETFKLFTPLGR